MFVYHENASGLAAFTRTGDAYAVDRDLKIAAVADSPLRYLVRSNIRNYPDDDNGLDAAQLFCDEMVQGLRSQVQEQGVVTTESLRVALKDANTAIAKLNQSLGKTLGDYENYDVAETVGMVAIQIDNKLIYGGLEDCYVIVWRGGDLKNAAPIDYQIMKSSRYLDKLMLGSPELDNVSPQLLDTLGREGAYEPLWAGYLRNNTQVADEDGAQLGWGCFTGEAAAEKFFQVHQLDLKPGDYVAVVSDGMLPAINTSGFKRWLVDNYDSKFATQRQLRKKIMSLFAADSLERYKEKTLVLWRYE